VEIGYVLADEVVYLGGLAAPPIVEVFALPVAPLARRGQVADRSVEPHVPIVAGTVGNLETEVRRRPRHVPIAQRLAEEMPLEVIGDLGLQGAAVGHPLVEEAVQLLDVDEQMRGRAGFRLGAGERADRVDQVAGS